MQFCFPFALQELLQSVSALMSIIRIFPERTAQSLFCCCPAPSEYQDHIDAVTLS